MQKPSRTAYGLSEREQPEMDRMVTERRQLVEKELQKKRRREESRSGGGEEGQEEEEEEVTHAPTAHTPTAHSVEVRWGIWQAWCRRMWCRTAARQDASGARGEAHGRQQGAGGVLLRMATGPHAAGAVPCDGTWSRLCLRWAFLCRRHKKSNIFRPP
jgi:hypothetical protein